MTLQRFPTINRKELETTLHLIPIEETAIGRELKQLWMTEGQKEGVKLGEKRGMTKGELIGQIWFAQKMLKQPISPVARLSPKSVKALKTMLRELEAELTAPQRSMHVQS